VESRNIDAPKNRDIESISDNNVGTRTFAKHVAVNTISLLYRFTALRDKCDARSLSSCTRAAKGRIERGPLLKHTIA